MPGFAEELAALVAAAFVLGVKSEAKKAHAATKKVRK